MTNKNMEKIITELKEYKLMKEDVESHIKELEDALKSEMETRQIDVLSVGIHKLTYKTITQKKFDSKALRAVNEDVYNSFLKQSSYKRFTVA